MPQVPTSSITMAQIKAETGVASNATLDAARAASISYVRGTGESPAGTGGNANATPNNMRDWAGYTHAVAFPDYETHARMGTTTGSWAVRSYTSHVASEAEAAGGIHIFQREISSDTVFQAELVTTLEAGVSSQAADNSYFTAGGTDPGTSASFGSFLNHSSPVTIMTIPGVTGITASASVAPVSGYSHVTYPASGETLHSSMASLSGFVARLGGYGAQFALNASGGVTTYQAYSNWTITISKSGYTTEALPTFTTNSRNIATSTGGGL
jgi:hypothetical protein